MNDVEREALTNFLIDIEILDGIYEYISEFNVFEILGVVNTEIKHSNTLALLFNPNENHNLGDLFIKKFIQSIFSIYKGHLKHMHKNIFDILHLDYYDFVIKREYMNIDIFVISEKAQFVIVIENKVWGKASENQFEKYFKLITEEYSDYDKLFILLTPYSDTEVESSNWISLDYNLIYEIIEKILRLKERNLDVKVRLFIEQYLAILRRYILMKDIELERICREIYYKHQKALDLIFEYKPDIYYDISNYLQNLINSKDNLIKDSCNKNFVRLITKELDDLMDKKEKTGQTAKEYFYSSFN
ncbi:PD-(D/E)XK nuclease family protein [Caldicellulosiruptor acetigenus]|uniref:PD-(D/E)XK nuclease superfamily protein n=1 Tax=Caldicellulosiruptor acetigenus 6A TaxID=632516 RepID=G2PY34_9FIRM|nr:PD-(D/E)XK nuclease family protein [Caldicellulosiruptor acetigenus]AEM74901.1 hypothetical protein Calla_2374 [Caldicellulosiruptor acetigenus 6A]